MEKVFEIKNIQNVLVDSDVFMDYFLDRKPHSTYSIQFLDICVRENIRLNATPLSFANIYYLLKRSSTGKKAINALRDLARMVNIIKMNDQAVETALDSEWKDFEDALQYFSAKQYKSIKAIVTRNKKDYSGSSLPVFNPSEMIRLIGL